MNILENFEVKKIENLWPCIYMLVSLCMRKGKGNNILVIVFGMQGGRRKEGVDVDMLTHTPNEIAPQGRIN